MKINVSTEVNLKANVQKVIKAIEGAEGKATARTLHTNRIPVAIASAEKELHTLRIPKKHWAGCAIALEPEALPNSYTYGGEGTYAIIKRFATGWFLVDVSRRYCRTCSYGKGAITELILSDKAFENIPRERVL